MPQPEDCLVSINAVVRAARQIRERLTVAGDYASVQVGEALVLEIALAELDGRPPQTQELFPPAPFGFRWHASPSGRRWWANAPGGWIASVLLQEGSFRGRVENPYTKQGIELPGRYSFLEAAQAGCLAQLDEWGIFVHAARAPSATYIGLEGPVAVVAEQGRS